MIKSAVTLMVKNGKVMFVLDMLPVRATHHL